MASEAQAPENIKIKNYERHAAPVARVSRSTGKSQLEHWETRQIAILT
jgi:hypothetical protein